MNRILGAVARRNTPANRRRALWALAAVPAWAAGGAAGMFLSLVVTQFVEKDLGFKPPPAPLAGMDGTFPGFLIDAGGLFLGVFGPLAVLVSAALFRWSAWRTLAAGIVVGSVASVMKFLVDDFKGFHLSACVAGAGLCCGLAGAALAWVRGRLERRAVRRGVNRPPTPAGVVIGRDDPAVRLRAALLAAIVGWLGAFAAAVGVGGRAGLYLQNVLGFRAPPPAFELPFDAQMLWEGGVWLAAVLGPLVALLVAAGRSWPWWRAALTPCVVGLVGAAGTMLAVTRTDRYVTAVVVAHAALFSGLAGGALAWLRARRERPLDTAGPPGDDDP